MFITVRQLLSNHHSMIRVKSLSKSGNSKKDQGVNSLPPISKDSSSASSAPISTDVEDVCEPPQQEVKVMDTGRRAVEKEPISYIPSVDYSKQPSSFSSSVPFNGREESVVASGSMDRERSEMNNTFSGSSIPKISSLYSQNSVDSEEKVQKVSPPRRKGPRDTEKSANWQKKDAGGSDFSSSNLRQPNTSSYSTTNVGSRKYEAEPASDGNINAGGSDFSSTNLRQPNTSSYGTTNVGSRKYEAEPAPDGNINALLEVVLSGIP